MNSIGWIVGHLAWHEQRTLLLRARGVALVPKLNVDFAFGAPMSTPSLKATRRAWNRITKEADPYLDSLSTRALLRDLPLDGKPSGQSLGSAIRRMTFHYWFHIGEIQAIRQLLGDKQLPSFVGNLEAKAPYRPDR